jgi:hypothetical protein
MSEVRGGLAATTSSGNPPPQAASSDNAPDPEERSEERVSTLLIQRSALQERVSKDGRPPEASIRDAPTSAEEAVGLAIAACDGDLHATIRALLVSNTFLQNQVERLRSLISPGFAPGRLSLLDLP